MKHIICKKDVLRNHKIFRFTCATTFSDGVSTVEQTVVEAIQKGLVSVGISEYSFTDFDQCYCMRQERLQEYCCEVRRVRNLYKDRLSSLMMDHVKYLYDGTMPRRMGNRYREWSPYGICPAKDGYYALGVGTENSIQLWRVTCFTIRNCWRMRGVDLITKE